MLKKFTSNETENVLRCKPKGIKSEKGCMCGLLKQTFADTELFFLLSILWNLENRKEVNTNFCDVSGDNTLLALLTT